MTAIDLTNVTIIYPLNETLLLHGGTNTMISTAQDREFCVAIHDIAKNHGVKQYIHDVNRIITMNFENYLMYLPIWKPTQWDIDKLECIMLTSDH